MNSASTKMSENRGWRNGKWLLAALQNSVPLTPVGK
jgi:hypothetical protein